MAAPSVREAPASAAASKNSAMPMTAAIANAVQNRFTAPLLVLARLPRPVTAMTSTKQLLCLLAPQTPDQGSPERP